MPTAVQNVQVSDTTMLHQGTEAGTKKLKFTFKLQTKKGTITDSVIVPFIIDRVLLRI